MPTRELERRAKEILSELVQLESAQTRARLLGKRCGSDEQLRETVISLCRDENLIRELTDWLPPVPPKQLMSIETLDSEIDSIVTSNAEADAAAHAHVQTQDQDSDDSSDTPTSWEFPSGIVTSVPASPVSTGSHSHGPLFPSVAVSRYDRFEIRGTLGEGGQGIVQTGFDPDLRREVALKVLKPKLRKNRGAQQVFKHEAEVTGRLEHPNIVPVYEAGIDDSSCAYYAMRIIREQSFDHAIQQFHAQPWSESTLRDLLGRFVDVCDAMAYAHSRGIIHRDLKPQNVMLGRFGETLVVDWGLAKRIDADDIDVVLDSEGLLDMDVADPQQATRVGALKGTPAFMSPEQARADGTQLGPASDIYSLGAILYCLLTGHAPPIIAAKTTLAATLQSNMSESENLKSPKYVTSQLVLKHVREADFPPPRTLNANIHPGLAAVCMLALKHDPQARYRTVDDLANDVRHWLKDEPVRAWPEPAFVRAKRWARKHQTLVTSAVAVCFVKVIALTILLAVIGHHNTEYAIQNQNLKVAKDSARHNEQVAREQSEVALKTLNDVIFDLQRGLKNVPGAQRARRDLLKGVVNRLQEVSDKYQTRAAIDRPTMAALQELAEVLQRVGIEPTNSSGSEAAALRDGRESVSARSDQAGSSAPAVLQAQESISALKRASELVLRAHEIASLLAKDQPDDSEAQRDLAVSHLKVGEVLRQSGQSDLAREHFQQALQLCDKLAVSGDSRSQRDLSVCLNHLGSDALRLKQVPLARTHYQRAFELRQRIAQLDPKDKTAQRDLAVSQEYLGDLAVQLGQWAEAQQHYERALEIDEQLAAAFTDDADTFRDLPLSYDRLGDVSLRAGQNERAQKLFEQSFTLRQSFVTTEPTDVRAKRDLWVSHTKLGDVFQDLSRIDAARFHFETALVLSRSLADLGDSLAQRDLLLTYLRLGDLALHVEDFETARGYYQLGFAISQKLAAMLPQAAQAQHDLAEIHARIGRVEKSRYHFGAAAREYERSRAVLAEYAERQSDATFTSEISDFKRLVVACEQAEAMLLDMDAAAASVSNAVSQLLLTRVQAFLNFASRTQGDLPIAIKDKWPSADRSDALFLEALRTSEMLRTRGAQNAHWLYNAGCGYSLCSGALERLTLSTKPDKAALQRTALDCLRAAIAAGWSNADVLEKDADLQAISKLPEFRELIDQLRRSQ